VLEVARKKIGLHFDGWEEYMAKLDELGGTQTMKKGVEEALTESKKHVNPLIEKAVAKGKLPAGGKYSYGGTKESIDNEMSVEWEGMTGAIKVGFDFSKSGLKSIFLMEGTTVHGSPRMKPVSGLKSAIYGAKTQKEIAEIQEKVLSEHIKRVMEG
jgi:hypothetical protein